MLPICSTYDWERAFFSDSVLERDYEKLKDSTFLFKKTRKQYFWFDLWVGERIEEGKQWYGVFVSLGSKCEQKAEAGRI